MSGAEQSRSSGWGMNEAMRTAFHHLHSYLGRREHTDLKVHFSHSRLARNGGPRRTPGCVRGGRGTWLRPARNLLGLRWALLPWRPGGGLCQPDRNLRWEAARCGVSLSKPRPRRCQHPRSACLTINWITVAHTGPRGASSTR